MGQKHITSVVSKERWEQAQKWERETWLDDWRTRSKYGKNTVWKVLATLGIKPKYRGDDWNYWWKHQFQGYNFLPDNVDNAIELGCGPYTNIRLMTEHCTPQHLILSDPLIKTYVNFKQTFVSDMYRVGQCIIDDHPIEECPFAYNYFDLVVMINVLDHVQDAELCMTTAINLVKPGGILVFGQDLTDEDDRKQYVEEDIGHPIMLDHYWVDGHISGKFDSIIKQILPRELGRAPQAHYGTYIFAGKKLN